MTRLAEVPWVRASLFHLFLDERQRSLEAMYSGAPWVRAPSGSCVYTSINSGASWRSSCPRIRGVRIHAMHVHTLASGIRTRTLQGGVNLASRPVSIAAETLPDHQSWKCSCGKWLPAPVVLAAHTRFPPSFCRVLTLLLSFRSFFRSISLAREPLL